MRTAAGVEYLFRAVEQDQVTGSFIKPARHTCFPIRTFGAVYALVDLVTGEKLTQQVPQSPLCPLLTLRATQQERDATRLCRVLSSAAMHIHEGDVPPASRPKEKFADWHEVCFDIDDYESPTNTDVFFERALLLDARLHIGKLDAAAFRPLRDAFSVSATIDKVVTSVLRLFVQDAAEPMLGDWSAAKQYLSNHLSRLIVDYDPTTQDHIERLLAVDERTSALSYGDIVATKSIPVIYLYTWLRVSVGLARLASQHAKRRPRARVITMSRSSSFTQAAAELSPRASRSSRLRDDILVPRPDHIEVADHSRPLHVVTEEGEHHPPAQILINAPTPGADSPTPRASAAPVADIEHHALEAEAGALPQ